MRKKKNNSSTSQGDSSVEVDCTSPTQIEGHVSQYEVYGRSQSRSDGKTANTGNPPKKIKEFASAFQRINSANRLYLWSRINLLI